MRRRLWWHAACLLMATLANLGLFLFAGRIGLITSSWWLQAPWWWFLLVLAADVAIYIALDRLHDWLVAPRWPR